MSIQAMSRQELKVDLERQPDQWEISSRPAGDRLRRSASMNREAIVVRCDAVIDIVAALFDLPSRELRRTGRSTSDIARARQIAMYVTHVVLQLSMAEVGWGFARDRTTVLHACHLIEDLRDDIEFDRIVSTVERVIKAAFPTP